MDAVCPLSAFQRRVSCTTTPPDSIIATWRAISWSMAFATFLNEFKFLISARVPRASVPRLRTDTFASQRSDPSSMLQSETPA